MTEIEKKTNDIHARIMTKCNERMPAFHELFRSGNLDSMILSVAEVMAEEIEALDKKKANFERRKK